jgi:hypothetical protein
MIPSGRSSLVAASAASRARLTIQTPTRLSTTRSGQQVRSEVVANRMNGIVNEMGSGGMEDRGDLEEYWACRGGSSFDALATAPTLGAVGRVLGHYEEVRGGCGSERQKGYRGGECEKSASCTTCCRQ